MTAVDTNPFFIVGSSRSGTTLLRLILAGHSRIAIPAETRFISQLAERLPITGPLSQDGVQSAINIVLQSAVGPTWRCRMNISVSRVRELVRPSLADVINVVYKHALHSAQKGRIGDKSPPYIFIAEELKLLFPQAKFINLIRDGRDVAISFIDAHFRGRPYHGRNFEWVRAVRRREDYRRASFARDFMDIRYEDLVTEPETITKRVCSFLDEEFEPGMLDFTTRIYWYRSESAESTLSSTNRYSETLSAYGDHDSLQSSAF